MDADLASPIDARLAALLRELERLDEPRVAEAVARARAAPRETMRIAVAGRVKAGKSTLVNALIGSRVAPTSAEECTRVVTEYRWGANAHAEVILRDGSRHDLPYDQALPERFDWPVQEIDVAVVHLPEAPLRRFSLVDTPGLSTTTVENEAATRRAVLAPEGAARVDSLVYVFRDAERADDAEFLRLFAGARERAAEAAIGVLSHADAFGGGAAGAVDPIDEARRYAREIDRRRPELSGVIALSGKLGEAATTGRVREADARLLRDLAALPADDLDLRLLPPEVSVEAVDELASRIGEYGLIRARGVAAGGAAAVTDWLLAASGVPDLARALRDQALGRQPHRRAAVALQDIEDAAAGTHAWEEVRRILHRAREHPDLHALREYEARTRVADADPASPLIDEFDRLLDAADDRERVGLGPRAARHEVHARALLLATEANRAANSSTSAAAVNGYRVLSRSYALIAQRSR